MATSCKHNWFWVYFTSVYNIAKCDICYTFFQITEVPKDNIMRHIETEHRDDYQRIVSSGNSQKDLESQLYIKQNNYITCKFCDSICYATNNSYSLSLIIHLKVIHNIKKDKAAKLCDELRKYYFDESDTDMRRRCTRCNESILNKPLVLLSHLSETHNVDVPLKSKGFSTSMYWLWEYFTKSEERVAKCSVCNGLFVLANSLANMKYHINSKHGNMSEVSENSQANKNWSYSIIENNKLKCDYCDKSYKLMFYATTCMKAHLIKAHNLNEDIARKLYNWILEYFHISNLQTSECNICENLFQTSNSFNLMIHLKEAHQVRVSPELIPAGYAVNNATSSSYQQPIQNFYQFSGSYNICDQIAESTENRLARYAENNATSSNYQQPIQNLYQNSDTDNPFDLIDEYTENELRRYAENNATSSNYQQPTQNLYQNSDTDNLFDLIDEYTENELKRHAENNATSSSYQQLTHDFD